MRLPIHDSREIIIKTVKDKQVAVLVGETGSGKTTQLPVFFYEAGLVNGGMLGVTQPRRIAAISVAEFVASQLGNNVGGIVGYQIRFDDQTADNTKIKFMTDGILLRELQLDPELSKYSIIMVDEAHERSQNIDFVLGLLKDLLKRRSDLKVVVTSATIDQEKFSQYFWNAPIINVSGRTYPVETVWSDRDYSNGQMMDAIVEKILSIHFHEAPGDILVFVSGVDDINKIIKSIEEQEIENLVLLPAHGNLDPEEQKKIFEVYADKRKVVVATNIAETSITLDNTVYVVDSGLIKQTNFHAESGIQSLDLVEHSQAGCNQRKGRAGRTQPGICHCMYREENFRNRQPFTTPEIMRASLANVVLMMEDIGIENIERFDFVDKPDVAAFREAYETLIALGAIRRGVKGLTDLGRSMAKLPLEPRIARMLLEAEKHGCVEEVATVSAFLSARNVFSRPKEKEWQADRAHANFKNPQSDVLTFLNIWEAYAKASFSSSWCFENFLNVKTLEEISKIRKQIIDILAHCGIENNSRSLNPEDVMKAVAMGLVYNLCIFTIWGKFAYQGVLRKVGEIFIHPGSSVFGQGNLNCFVSAKVVQTSKNYAHVVTTVKTEWLREMVPHLCTFGKVELLCFEPKRNIVVAQRDVVIEGRTIGKERFGLSIEDADLIQQKQIENARENGWRQMRMRVSGTTYMDKKIVAYSDNEEVDVPWSSYAVEDGDIYFCHVEQRHEGFMANPKFKVIQFPIKEEAFAETPIRTEIDLSGLSAKWARP